MFNIRTMNRRMRMLIISFSCCITVLMLILSGCSAKNEANSNQVKTYGHDGYMGISNSNPNIPNGHTYLNYKSDGKFVGEVLSRLEGIKNKRLYFNGEQLRVQLKVDPKLSDGEMSVLQQKAQTLVQENMPRYKVKVETTR